MTESERITRALQGHWYGRYGLAFCPAHNNIHTPALSLSDGYGGRLLAHCHAGCAFAAVLDALRGLGLIDGHATYFSTSASDLLRNHAAQKAEAIKRERQALAIWHETMPIHGTIAETYLREARGITCALPPTLRFHPAAWHGPSGKRLPAMVALVECSGQTAIHRTYLQSDGRGKALLGRNKMMLGATKGGAVRLSEVDGPLVVAEGIETALSLLCGLLDGAYSVWAGLSASGIQGLTLPPNPGGLIIATDSDDNGASAKAGYSLASIATSLGWNVFFMPAPDCKDWNDVLQDGGIEE